MFGIAQQSATAELIETIDADVIEKNLTLVGIKRDQDPIGIGDVARLHGYVVLKFEDMEGEHKFLRIDWCTSGFKHEFKDRDDQFCSYMDLLPAEVDAQHLDTVAGAGVAIPQALPVFSAKAASVKLATLAGNHVAPFVTGEASVVIGGAAPALKVAAGVAVGVAAGAAGVAVTAHIQHRWADYTEPSADVSVKSLKTFIRQLHPRKTEVRYELTSFNCNHVANSIFEFVTGTSSSSSEGEYGS